MTAGSAAASASAGASLSAPTQSAAAPAARAAESAAASRPKRRTRPPSRLSEMSATPASVVADDAGAADAEGVPNSGRTLCTLLDSGHNAFVSSDGMCLALDAQPSSQITLESPDCFGTVAACAKRA